MLVWIAMGGDRSLSSSMTGSSRIGRRACPLLSAAPSWRSSGSWRTRAPGGISSFATQEGMTMATSSDQAVLGSPAPEFRLRGTDGKFYSYGDVAGERGTVIVFICNHCPYVKAVIATMVRDVMS